MTRVPRSFIPLDFSIYQRLNAWLHEPRSARFVGMFSPAVGGVAWHTGSTTSLIGFADEMRSRITAALMGPGGTRLGDVVILDRHGGQGWAAPWQQAIQFLHLANDDKAGAAS
jgi:hypothetical protein